MSFMKIGLGDVQEQETVPENSYKYEVISCKIKPSKNTSRTVIHVVLQLTNPPKDVPFPQPVLEFFVMPNAADYKENKEMATDWVRRLRRFLECSGIPYTADGFEPEEAVGATGETLFKLTEEDDGEWRNKPVWPRYANS